MPHENYQGEGHNGPLGFRMKGAPPGDPTPRQLVDHFVETTALRSKSKGWLPYVRIRLEHLQMDAEGEREVIVLLVPADAMGTIAMAEATAAERAPLDLEVWESDGFPGLEEEG